jgi:hypothetical protein
MSRIDHQPTYRPTVIDEQHVTDRSDMPIGRLNGVSFELR